MKVNELLRLSMGVHKVYLYTLKPHTIHYERHVYNAVTTPLLYMNTATVEHFRPCGYHTLTIYCRFDDDKDYTIY